MSATIAMLAGLGKGYLDGTEKRAADERLARKDALEKELHDARMAEVRREQDDRAAVQKLMTDGGDVQALSPAQALIDAPVSAKPVREQTRVRASELPAADGPALPAEQVTTPPVSAKVPEDMSAFPEVKPSTMAVNGIGSAQSKQGGGGQAEMSASKQERIRQLALSGNKFAIEAARNMSLFEDEDTKRRKASADAANEGTLSVLMGATHGAPVAQIVDLFESRGKAKFARDEDGNPLLSYSPYETKNADGSVSKKVRVQGTLEDGRTFNVDDAEQAGRALYVVQKGFGHLEAREDKDKQRDLDERKFGLEKDKAKTDADYKSAMVGIYGRNADTAAARANGAGGGNGYERLDEGVKLELKAAYDATKEAEKAYTDALKLVQPGEDPATYPAVKHAQQQLTRATQQRLQANIKHGQVTVDELASKAISAAQTPEDVMKHLNQLLLVAGSDVADAVGERVMQSDVWRQMTSKKDGDPLPATAAGEKKVLNAKEQARLDLARQGVKPGYRPPAGSPAGKAQAAREAKATANSQAQSEKTQAAAAAAEKALSSKDPADAQAAQDMPGFSNLPTQQQAEIRRIVFGK